MLEVRINEGEIMINLSGRPTEVMADITLMLKIIYEKLNNDGKEIFEECLKATVENRIYAKNEEEMDKLNKEQMEKTIKKMMEENPEELFKKLKEIFK